MNIRDFVGKRCLLNTKIGSWSGTVGEFRILEVSPSGNWVKIMNTDGRKFWRGVTEVSFVEELRDFKAEKLSETGG